MDLFILLNAHLHFTMHQVQTDTPLRKEKPNLKLRRKLPFRMLYPYKAPAFLAVNIPYFLWLRYQLTRNRALIS